MQNKHPCNFVKKIFICKDEIDNFVLGCFQPLKYQDNAIMQANTIQPKGIEVVVRSGNHIFIVSDGAMAGQEGQDIVQNQVHTNISFSLFLKGTFFYHKDKYTYICQRPNTFRMQVGLIVNISCDCYHCSSMQFGIAQILTNSNPICSLLIYLCFVISTST